ncbi:hypothetical protein ACU686_12230 [Yinghuangia aomiensis]
MVSDLDRDWAAEAVRGLGRFSTQEELLAAVSRTIGRDLVVVLPDDEDLWNRPALLAFPTWLSVHGSGGW